MGVTCCPLLVLLVLLYNSRRLLGGIGNELLQLLLVVRGDGEDGWSICDLR